MAKNISLKKNFIMNAILTMSSFIFPLITFPYVSRILGPEGTGKVSFATSLISYFLIIAQLGIPTYGVRACARVRDDKIELTRTAHELLFINLIMSAASYILLALCLAFVPRLQADKPLYVVVSFTIILTTIGMEWLYKALEQYTYITVRSIIFKFVALIAMFLLIHSKSDYVIYGGITILASSASNVFNFINAHKYIGMKPVGGYNLKRHIKPVLVFFAMACATTIYTNLDNIMLGFMTTDKDVGYYNAAVKIKNVLVSVVTSLGTVLLPRASYYVEHNDIEDFKRISAKALNFVVLLASPLMIYFMIFARQGIYFLSGPEYTGSIRAMQIIMPTILLIGLTNILGIQVLVPLGREKVVLVSEIAGAVTDLILNWIFIPVYKSAGAAFGTLMAELVVFIVQYYALHNEVGEIFKKIPYFRIALCVLLGSAASFWVSYLNLGNFVTLVISAVLFFAVYIVFLLALKVPLAKELVFGTINGIKNKLHKEA